jgi:uncharacterized protein YutE (UPF0331/DUF86 family)
MADDLDLFGNKIPEEPTYSVSLEKKIGVSALRKADSETQEEVMKAWFFEHFENPVENTPYMSSEGGYQYIHGGPYDAQEQLQEEFAGIVPDEVIEELSRELDDISTEWAGIPDDSDLDDYVFESITQTTEYYQSFLKTISNTRHLATVAVQPPQAQHLYRLLYLSAIIALETYLSDTFIAKVCADPQLLRKFVENDRYFSKDSVPIREVFKFTDSVKDNVKAYLLKLVWHRITDSQRMFFETLGVTFPKDLEELTQAIRVRHDIVHRSGKTKDGKEHQLAKTDVEKVAGTVEEVVWWIETQINPQAEKIPTSMIDNAEF